MKKIVCRCHDITESDIEDAIDAGYDDIETLKRITGFTTGHCQGKTCLPLVMKILENKTGKKVQEAPRTRAPIDTLTLGSLATGEHD